MAKPDDDPDGRFGRIMRRIGRGVMIVGGAAGCAANTHFLFVAATPLALGSMGLGAKMVSSGAWNQPLLPVKRDTKPAKPVFDYKDGYIVIDHVRVPIRSA